MLHRVVPRAPIPFPFASLPKVDRATARLTRRIAATLASSSALPAGLFDARWSGLLGDDSLRRIGGTPRPVALADLRAAWSADPTLVSRWNHPTLGPFLLAVPRALAFLLVTRALGTDAWISPTAPWSDVAEGVLSALAARVAVTLTAPAAPPTLRAITDHPDDALDTLPPGHLVAWDLTLAGKTVAGVLTLVLLADELPAPPPVPSADLLSRFSYVAVSVRCVGARSMVAATDVDALAAGDHVLLDGLRWSSSALAGDVTLCLGEHPPLRLDASVTDASSVTVTRPPRDPWSPAMSDSTDVFAALQVEVTVELASQSASLETVASWGVGAVVEFSQRIGEAVLLRAGGRVIARGELVDVDGQVGVRITARS